MAVILIRNVPEDTVDRLRQRAARHGRSMEAELRETLEQLASAEAGNPDDHQPFGTWLMSISRPGMDLTNIST
jgi:plasmid stability protein